MRRRHPNRFRVLQSATPAFASVVAAAAYGVGAIVFSFTSKADPADLPEFSLSYDPPSLYVSGIADPAETDLVALAAPEEVASSQVVVPEIDEMLEAQPASYPVPTANTPPRIALVIDDVGLDRDAARRTSELGVPISMAVLPYADASRDVSRQVREAGHDLLLHMPMEPLGLADPGPHALRVGQSEDELRLRVRWAFARVPGAIGMNNHMGSRLTQDTSALRPVLEALSQEAGLFLDSMTTAESRGAAVARGLGLTALERDIFLDHTIEVAAINARLAEVEALASLRGWAIAIGHPHDETLEALESWIAEAEARGFEFVTLTELARSLETPSQQIVEASIR
ncbi:divergent polysaccharide deacetylase family protein [Maricaulis sp.]|uniref:divergent polysaccharide deacetylase family protein n=1 Tax=Maricaulis sp. TaxID=1486257 RepID=UPI001AFEACFA|nr:divergent polysaccharide deacetylase family protein [Maricaulis sp.]MBO6797810.1 divergent polysaccharide deacetylase family protein [Maricaulis sp.]